MAKQAYSIDEGKMVEVQDEPLKVEKTVTKKELVAEEEEEDEPVETEEEKIAREADEEAAKVKKEGEGEGEGEEEEEEEEEDTKKEPEVKIDDFIKNNFAETYGIKTEEQFKEVLDRSAELIDEVESLTEENKKLKEAPTEPIFKSENQKAVFNLLKDFDPDKLPDGLHMVAGLIGMDLEKTDPKLILEQEFIMKHPELSLDMARKKFQRRYESKYVVKEEDFESDEAYKDKKEDIDSDIVIDAAQAKKFIKEKQKDFKDKSESKPESEKVNEEIISGIASNAEEFSEHFNGWDTLTFEIEEGDKNPFNYKFSKEQLGKIKIVAEDYLKNPNFYDAKGKLIGGFDPEEKLQQAAFALYGPKMMEEALKSARKYAQVLKVDDVAKKHPQRKAKSSGELENLGIDAQADRLAAKKKAEREAAKGR